MKHKGLTMIGILSLMNTVILSFLTFKSDQLAMDLIIMKWIKEISTPWILEAMGLLTIIGSGEFIIFTTFLIACILAYKKHWLMCFFFTFVTGSGIVFNYVMKVLFQRERPEDTEYVEVSGYSFELVSYSYPRGM